MLYWLLKYLLVGPWIFVMGRPTFSGREHVPKKGGALLAVNHLSASDWLFLPLSSQRRITFLAKSEYFTRTGPYGKFQKFFFSQTGQVPIDRSSADAATNAMETGLRLLQDDKILGMFPEGTRSPDGKLYRGKTGIARVALRAGVPVIPVGIIGTDKFLPKNSLIPRPAKIHVKIGPPIDISRWEGRVGDREAERELTDEIMAAIYKLSGQAYVPEIYGAQAQKELDKNTGMGTE